MSSSLNIGTTGLAASEKQMDVIGNNLANANTVGFKAADTYFASMLSQSLSGGGGAASVGQGVGVAAVSTVFSQGTFQTTGNATDAAIDGNGFFIVKDKDGNALYTRAGGFHINSVGVLSDINNYAVQGHTFDPDGVVEYQNMSALNLQNAQSKPAATTYFGVGMTLDSGTLTGQNFNSSQVVYDSRGAKHNLNTIFTKTEDPNMWAIQTTLDQTANAVTTVIPGAQDYNGMIFDATTGNVSQLYTSAFGTGGSAPTAGNTVGTGAISQSTLVNGGLLYQAPTAVPFKLVQTGAAGNWDFVTTLGVRQDGGYANAKVIYSAGTGTANDTVGIDLDGNGSADITFGLDDNTKWKATDTISFAYTRTVTAVDKYGNNNIAFAALNDGSTIGVNNVLIQNFKGLPNHDAPVIKSFATTSRISSMENDGYAPGTLSSLVINKDGIVEGMFSNGQRQNLARLLLGDFTNLQGLNKVGSYFIETADSGPSVDNKPGSGGLGELQSSSLEMSNTDTAKEFIKMITAQRAYQSSAKIIATADQMLQTLMNVKQ